MELDQVSMAPAGATYWSLLPVGGAQGLSKDIWPFQLPPLASSLPSSIASLLFHAGKDQNGSQMTNRWQKRNPCLQEEHLLLANAGVGFAFLLISWMSAIDSSIMWFARVRFKPQVTIMALFVEFISVTFNEFSFENSSLKFSISFL